MADQVAGSGHRELTYLDCNWIVCAAFDCRNASNFMLTYVSQAIQRLAKLHMSVRIAKLTCGIVSHYCNCLTMNLTNSCDQTSSWNFFFTCKIRLSWILVALCGLSVHSR